VKRRDTSIVKVAAASFRRTGLWAAGVALGMGLVWAGSAQDTDAQTLPSLRLDDAGSPIYTPQQNGNDSSQNNVSTQYQNQYQNGSQGQYQNGQNPNQNGQNQYPNGQGTTRRNGTGSEIEQDRLMNNALPPEPLTEFQRLVIATTGRELPIFGASLFRRDVPSTFAPVDNLTVSPDYVIGPGDELRLQIWGQVNQQGSFMVDRTGAISVPQMGTIHVAGQRYDQLHAFLNNEFGRVYRNFNLTVSMGQLRSIQVFVVGQARRPGSYTISSLSTLLNALFASGGPESQGSLRDIQVRRGTETVVHFDLYDLLLHGDKSKDVPLSPGDVIFIPPVGPQVALSGSVNNAAIYELKKGPVAETVADLIELGGGLTSSAAGPQIRLERIVDRSALSVVEVDLSKPNGATLQNGDIVSVVSIVERFKDAVTLRGNVANPGRYVWHSGMRISDLIPNKEMLVTRNYWRKREQLGQTATGYQVLQNDSNSLGGLQLRQQPNGNGVSQARGNAQDSQQQERTTQTGSSVATALTQSSDLFSAKNDIVLSAPDINWSYAVIERQNAMTLKTSLIPFSLGKVILDGDQTQNLELLAGDVVTIFSTADLGVPTSEQTRFVKLEGEFVAAGVYSVRPGETLRQLLQRAGGFTTDAYLYGSEFTRQSTKRVEELRLKEYADQLEAQVSAESSGLVAKAVSDRDAAAASAAATAAQGAIARLRRVEPDGRIVLQLKPDSRTIDAVPDLALEDGDRFVVPRVPSHINVEGQVYSANAFVFERGHRVKDYLKMAGGPARQADARRMFVVRADGSVYSRQYGNLEKSVVFPGDTIVVPLQVDHRAVLRNLVDIATIVGQFGIGVAAINVLK
jgi:polysaccharide biosynthesis/export protein